MLKKYKAARRHNGLAPLKERHSYWTGGSDGAALRLNLLAVHYRVPMTVFPYSPDVILSGGTEGISASDIVDAVMGKGPSASEVLDLLVAVAADIYPAFEKLPSKGGRRRNLAGLGLLNSYPNAHAARLVQLFNFEKQKRKQRGDSTRIDDICKTLARLYGGKYPHWRYNNQKTGSSLRRHAWSAIPKEIKANPERFLPADGSEPTWFNDQPYLPPPPSGKKKGQ